MRTRTSGKLIDGVFEAAPAPSGPQGEGAHFHEASTLRDEDIAAVQRKVRIRVLRRFARRGLITPEVAAERRRWEHGHGFFLDAAVRIDASDRKRLEHLARPHLMRSS